jgi:flagellar M-ring protein FliF
MVKIVDDWRGLSVRNQIIAIAAVAGVIVAFSFLMRQATAPRMSLLYAGLDAASSGEILEALEGMDVKAEVRGDAIYVVENRRDSVRMALAGEGLPRQGQAGFELLDQLNGLATTSDMFDATYWRAKEGELARTILATPGVRTARVHIAAPKRSAFSRERIKPSAVVTVGMGRGRLDLERARSMRYVVALAVPDLAPDDVAVIDAAGGAVVLAPGGGEEGAGLADQTADREQALERDLAALLEARVGAGNARVKVAVELTHEQQSRVERLLDPQRRILTNRESSEISEQGSDGAGVVTVASNLPEGDVEQSTTPQQSRRSETTENTRFDVSETRTEVVSTPGALKRIQVAVLINEAVAVGENGEITSTPRTPEELEALKKLVAAAVGFDEERGDVVTIESLAFDQPKALGEAVEKNPVMDFLANNVMSLLQLVIPAIVSLILALFVLRPILASGSGERGVGALAPPLAGTTPAALTSTAAASAAAVAPPPSPVDELHRVAAQQQSASAAVLKTWLEQSENAA